MMESIDDLTAPWTRHGAGLAQRMLALADEMDFDGEPRAAAMVRSVIRCDYDPLPPAHPPLGDPPTVRPAVQPKPEAGS